MNSSTTDDRLPWSRRCSIQPPPPRINMTRLFTLLLGSVVLGALLGLLAAHLIERFTMVEPVFSGTSTVIQIWPTSPAPSCEDCNSLRKAEI